MTRWTRFIPVVAVSLVIAACGQGTTDTPLSPPTARFDGGGASLGGNFVPPDSTQSGTTTSSTTADDPNALPTDATSRTGGASLGGN